MSYTYSFFDNQQVGAEDLNKIAKLFISSGVQDPFENGVPYSVTKLNDVVYTNASSGVVPQTSDTLKVVKNGNTVTINTGTAFFDDGTVMTITNPETVSVAQNTVQYISLVSSVNENRAYISVTSSLPSGNAVTLAKINADGTVEDLRTYAKGKVPSFYCSDAGCAVMAQKTINYGDTHISLITGNRSCNFVVLRCKFRRNNNDIWTSVAFVNLADNTAFSAYSDDPTGTTSAGTCYGNGNKKFVIAQDNYGGVFVQLYGQLTVSDSEIGIDIDFNPNINEDEGFFSGYVYPIEVTAYAF